MTQSQTKPRTKTVKEEVVLVKEGINLKDLFHGVQKVQKMPTHVSEILYSDLQDRVLQ